MGRTIMEAYGMQPQSILTVPLLVGTDGEQKMSKSYGNYIGVSESPNEMFGKAMSHSRFAHVTYWSLLTGATRREVELVERRLAEGEYHPAEAKRDLATRLVTLYHSADEAAGARAHFDRVFKEKDQPAEIPEAAIPPGAVQNGLIWCSASDRPGIGVVEWRARRLIEQGGVRLDGVVLQDPGPSSIRRRCTGRCSRWQAEVPAAGLT